MLHAVIHNKKAQKRGNAWTLEDNVTSTFFGPLCFLSNEDIVAILSTCFPNVEEEIKSCSAISFDFWPRLKLGVKSSRSGLIEPDLIIHFKFNGVEAPDFILLIEVKWQGYPYKDKDDKHQVHKQIDAIQKEWNPNQMKAIYLTQYHDKQDPGKEYNGVAISSVKWVDVAHRLSRKIQVSSGAHQWQQLVVEYLEKLLDTLFYGFTKERFAKPSAFTGEKVFFSPFVGFTNPEVTMLEKKIFLENHHE